MMLIHLLIQPLSSSSLPCYDSRTGRLVLLMELCPSDVPRTQGTSSSSSYSSQTQLQRQRLHPLVVYLRVSMILRSPISYAFSFSFSLSFFFHTCRSTEKGHTGDYHPCTEAPKPAPSKRRTSSVVPADQRDRGMKV
jgi:hypothetical protein